MLLRKPIESIRFDLNSMVFQKSGIWTLSRNMIDSLVFELILIKRLASPRIIRCPCRNRRDNDDGTRFPISNYHVNFEGLATLFAFQKHLIIPTFELVIYRNSDGWSP